MIAALAAGIGAVLSFVGLIHADKVEWAAAPQVALGYALLALVLVGIGLMQRNQPAVPIDRTGQRRHAGRRTRSGPRRSGTGAGPGSQTATAPDPATV